MTDPGASSSGPSIEANQTKQKIQALRNAFDQVEQSHKSSSWMTSFMFNIVRFIIDTESKETVAGGHNSSLTTIRKIKTIIRDATWPITDYCINRSAAIEELQRLLDSFSESDISKAYLHKKTQEDDQIAANYLFRHNHFEAGDAFISEAGVPETFSLKSQYKKMHAILKALNEHKIDPAIKWIIENRGHPQLSGSRLKFNVYRQKYLQMLKDSDGERKDAVDFMKKHLITFGLDYLKEINKLAGCMLWRGRLHKAPYVDLLSSATWENLAKDFTEKFLALAEQPPDS